MACSIEDYDDDDVVILGSSSGGSRSPCDGSTQLPSKTPSISDHLLADNQHQARKGKWLDRNVDSIHNIHMKREVTWLNEKEVLLEKIHLLRCELNIMNENEKDLHEQNAQLQAKCLTLHAENMQMKQDNESARQPSTHPSAVSYLLSFFGHR